jgi:hypothetical protein
MTAEHDNAKPHHPSDYASVDDLAGLHRGDAHVERSHIPCEPAPDGALSKFRSS